MHVFSIDQVYCRGVHSALLQLGYDSGLQGKSCEEGVQLLFAAISKIQGLLIISAHV